MNITPLVPGVLPIMNISRTATSDDVILQQRLQRYAYGYVMLVLCVTGLLGNMMTFAVLSRKTMRTSSTALYLRSLAVADALVLVLAVFR